MGSVSKTKIYNLILCIVFAIAALTVPFKVFIENSGSHSAGMEMGDIYVSVVWLLPASQVTFLLLLLLSSIVFISISTYLSYTYSEHAKTFGIIYSVVFFITVLYYFSLCIVGTYMKSVFNFADLWRLIGNDSPYLLPDFWIWIMALLGLTGPITYWIFGLDADQPKKENDDYDYSNDGLNYNHGNDSNGSDSTYSNPFDDSNHHDSNNY